MNAQQEREFFSVQTKLGLVHSLILRDVRRWLDQKATTDVNQKVYLYDVRGFVENKVMTLMRDKNKRPYPNIFNCMAFPVGVNKNNVAAHYSPRDWEQEVLDLKKDSVSIDFGLMDPLNGVLTDGAFTWNGSENVVGQQLTTIAKDAVDLVIGKSGPDVILGELGKECEEFVKSKEVVIEGKEECQSVTTLKELCGHKISPYVIHAGKAVPSVYLPQYRLRMEAKETYAIEVFPTTGDGKSYEVPVSEQVPSHLALCGNVLENLKKQQRAYVAKLMAVASTRRYVPFDPDWYNMEDRLIEGGLKDEMWKAYPAIKTCDGSPVVQWEKMVRIEEGGGARLLVQV